MSIEWLFFASSLFHCLCLASVPDIFLNQIIHVKDENEFGDQIDTINMAEATEQMLNHMINFQPVIRLKRVRLDDDIEI